MMVSVSQVRCWSVVRCLVLVFTLDQQAFPSIASMPSSYAFHLLSLYVDLILDFNHVLWDGDPCLQLDMDFLIVYLC